MFWPEITYFSNVLCTNVIHIECFVLKLCTFRIFWESENSQNFLFTKYDFYRMFRIEIQYFSCLLDQNDAIRIRILILNTLDTFQYFGKKTNKFRMFWIQIRSFSNVLPRNQKNFKCFVLKFDTFQMFQVKNKYFSTFLGTNTKCFEYFL